MNEEIEHLAATKQLKIFVWEVGVKLINPTQVALDRPRSQPSELDNAAVVLIPLESDERATGV